MDRPVKPGFIQNRPPQAPPIQATASQPEVAQFARTLLSPAPAIEGPRPPEQTMAQALNLLGTLENFARDSFALAKPPTLDPPKLDPKAQAQAEARAALARALRGRTSPLPPATSSQTPRQPSSQAPRKNSPQISPPRASQPQGPVFGSNRPQYQSALQDRRVIEALLDFQRKARETPAEQKPLSAFVLPDHPRVDAQPKPRGLDARRTPGGAYPVLRSPRRPS